MSKQFSQNMKYTGNLWITLSGNTATLGLTKEALEEMGEIDHLQLPEIGEEIRSGDEVCVLESSKAAMDLVTPLSGRVLEVNEALLSDISLLNEFPEEKGWLLRIELTNTHEYEKI